MDNINLASDKLGTTVCCDSVSNEDYPCQNLLKDCDKGFMVEYFIRPPVSVTVHLPFPVILSSISWSTSVGSQSCSLHEVSTSTTTALNGRACTSASCKLSSDNFWKVGRGIGEKGTISFFNRRVVVTQDGLRLGCIDNRDALTGVTAVRVTILRTERNTVPCIRNLRIFGVSTGRPELAHLEQELIRKSHQQGRDKGSTFNYFGGEDSGSSQSTEVVTVTDAGVSNRQLKDQEPPAEFLDSITHCLMQLPMTLPSGHLVDRSTLDKCQDSFAAWGGQPRDPFTGKLFSEKVKPVFNAGLKSRIDSFLLNSENRDSFRSTGRTLGSAQIIQEFLQNKGKKRRLPSYDENIRDSSDKVIKLDSTDDELDTSDLDTVMFKTLYKVKENNN